MKSDETSRTDLIVNQNIAEHGLNEPLEVRHVVVVAPAARDGATCSDPCHSQARDQNKLRLPTGMSRTDLALQKGHPLPIRGHLPATQHPLPPTNVVRAWQSLDEAGRKPAPFARVVFSDN
jgi:hypothetical protein